MINNTPAKKPDKISNAFAVKAISAGAIEATTTIKTSFLDLRRHGRCGAGADCKV
jgi:hypothetical protein